MDDERRKMIGPIIIHRNCSLHPPQHTPQEEITMCVTVCVFYILCTQLSVTDSDSNSLTLRHSFALPGGQKICAHTLNMTKATEHLQHLWPSVDGGGSSSKWKTVSLQRNVTHLSCKQLYKTLFCGTVCSPHTSQLLKAMSVISCKFDNKTMCRGQVCLCLCAVYVNPSLSLSPSQIELLTW